MLVSVSLRSIIHSYKNERSIAMLTSSNYVSVSLRSIIHSYYIRLAPINFNIVEFPSPYGVSFILIVICLLVYYIFHWSFRLLTEYHSFLYGTNTNDDESQVTFPSPYGVSFILIIYEANNLIDLYYIQFPSPYGVSFILILWSKKSFIAIIF